MSVLIWVQTVCKDYREKVKVAASKERVTFCILVSVSISGMNVNSQSPNSVQLYSNSINTQGRGIKCHV